MSNIAKAGLFSDGGHRLRIVTAGNNADPMPSNPADIVFDSDWGEMLPTASGYYGSATLGMSTSWQTISFPSALAYVPFASMAFTPTSFGSTKYVHVWQTGVWYQAKLAAAGQSNGFSGLGAYFGPVVEIFDDHLAVYYNQYSAGGDYEGFATQVEIAWVVWMTSTALTAFGSRAGTNWMQWTAAGPVVAKPGFNVSAASADDFLIPPNASGRILGQPFLSGVYPAGSGATTIPHNLGYIPIWWADQQVAPTYAPDIVTLDTANLYITPRGSTTLGPVSYSILAQQWV
jgi:hypothetical protein